MDCTARKHQQRLPLTIKNLNDADLTNSENVIKLITVLLDIETSPTPALLGSKDWSKIKGIVPVR